MDPFLKIEVNRLDNMIFWLQNIKESPVFADKEQEKLKRAFKLVESVASNYESGNKLSGKYSWNKKPARLKKENECLKEMINKFQSGEYTRKKLLQEYRLLIDKDNKEV